MIILDTSVVSEPFYPKPNPLLRTWLDSYPKKDLFICAPVLAELRYGIERLQPSRRRDDLERLVTHAETRIFAERILSFDRESAHAFGRVVAQRYKSGRPIQPIDAQIAAIALAHGMAVATRDIRDFDGIDLVVVNPFDLTTPR